MPSQFTGVFTWDYISLPFFFHLFQAAVKGEEWIPVGTDSTKSTVIRTQSTINRPPGRAPPRSPPGVYNNTIEDDEIPPVAPEDNRV
jgi:hypothetical protein